MSVRVGAQTKLTAKEIRAHDGWNRTQSLRRPTSQPVAAGATVQERFLTLVGDDDSGEASDPPSSGRPVRAAALAAAKRRREEAAAADDLLGQGGAYEVGLDDGEGLGDDDPEFVAGNDARGDRQDTAEGADDEGPERRGRGQKRQKKEPSQRQFDRLLDTLSTRELRGAPMALLTKT